MQPPRHYPMQDSTHKNLKERPINGINKTIARSLTRNEDSMKVNFIDNLKIVTSCTFNTSITKLTNKTQQDLDFPHLAIICYVSK